MKDDGRFTRLRYDENEEHVVCGVPRNDAQTQPPLWLQSYSY